MERRAIDISGIVQGVGFRPFVHTLATRFRLSGFVTNHGGHVQIEVEGDRDALEHFERELAANAPPLARVDSMAVRTLSEWSASLSGERPDGDFRIEPSRGDTRLSISIAPDAATCDACLAELFDPSDRRYRYPFINCTACGHHHAHVASCMAEHGVDAPVIGVAWDGAGWGPDGCVWGGEFLVGDRRDVHRAAHLRSVALPGGDGAAREPWRMALAHLRDADIDSTDALGGVPSNARKAITQMIDRGLNAPMTWSVGRVFEAVLCGWSTAMTFEGQAAMWLESLAEQTADTGRYPFTLTESTDAQTPLIVDTRPLMRAIDDDRRRGIAKTAVIARRFHRTLADVVFEVARVIRASHRRDACGAVRGSLRERHADGRG